MRFWGTNSGKITEFSKENFHRRVSALSSSWLIAKAYGLTSYVKTHNICTPIELIILSYSFFGLFVFESLNVINDGQGRFPKGDVVHALLDKSYLQRVIFYLEPLTISVAFLEYLGIWPCMERYSKNCPGKDTTEFAVRGLLSPFTILYESVEGWASRVSAQTASPGPSACFYILWIFNQFLATKSSGQIWGPSVILIRIQ